MGTGDEVDEVKGCIIIASGIYLSPKMSATRKGGALYPASLNDYLR